MHPQLLAQRDPSVALPLGTSVPPSVWSATSNTPDLPRFTADGAALHATAMMRAILINCRSGSGRFLRASRRLLASASGVKLQPMPGAAITTEDGPADLARNIPQIGEEALPLGRGSLAGL